MVLKIFALGYTFIWLRFFFSKNAYLKESWNILDFLIVISSLVTYFSN